MFTENFFNLLLNLEDNWVVKSVKTDINKGEVSLHIKCLLELIEDKETRFMIMHLNVPDAILILCSIRLSLHVLCQG